MNKEKLNTLFNDFLAQVEKLESKKAKYQKWYDSDWKKILTCDIEAECSELEYDLSHAIKNNLLEDKE